MTHENQNLARKVKTKIKMYGNTIKSIRTVLMLQNYNDIPFCHVRQYSVMQQKIYQCTKSAACVWVH